MRKFEVRNYMYYVQTRLCVLAHTQKGAMRWINANGFYDGFNYLVEVL